MLEREDPKAMGTWDHGGGISYDASVRIEADDRLGLERLLCCCARPAFALEWQREIDAEHLVTLTRRVSTSMTRPERMLPATSMARHSRVNSSMTVRHLSF